MCGAPMATRVRGRRELLDRWRAIQEELEEEEEDPAPSRQRQIRRAKEEWFSVAFDFLVNLPEENHIWCGCWDIMGPLLETFHDYFDDTNNVSSVKILWKRISWELGVCTQCICQHHQAQETYNAEYESDTVVPLLKVLHCLDEERVTEHLKEINGRILHKEFGPERHSANVVSVMFEVLMFPVLLDDKSLVNEFQIFLEAIDDSHEVTLSSHQQYPGVYALLFLKSGRARAIGLRLAGCMGKLRRATDLEPLQPLLRKYIGVLESEVLPSSLDASRPRLQLERIDVWHGIKTLLGFLEAPAFEDGILEKYPIFLSIVLNHVNDDSLEFSCAVNCLKASFEMLGCKLWLRTTLSPSMMRNTLLGQCFHTRNEKSHKEIFDLFLPFLQSLEALQDGEHEKQRRHILYFLLHQVTQSSNFSALMRKNACKIALLIIHRGYTMNPPCPPFECAHMWGPSLVSSLKDSSLHSSLRQPAFDLIYSIIISDAAALVSLKFKYHVVSNIDVSTSAEFIEDEDEPFFSHDVEEKDNSCWSEFSTQNRLASRECEEWICVPMLWLEAFVEVGASTLPIPFSKAAFWALSHISMLEPCSNVESSLSVKEWLSSYAMEISSSLGWEVPNGSDDGGDGKLSRNAVKASSACNLLIRTFKRFAAHFIMQIEQHELQKQWTWEPRMAESLILLLIDPNDSIRQADRVILEHVSKSRGLTAGLQFLCSSASSLSAIFLGLRYALKQVQVVSISANFQNLHHLYFITCKLLKDVITQKSPLSLKHDPKSTKLSSEGGFLRQSCSNHLPVRLSENSAVVVDVKSWEKFSCLFSADMWPNILICLREGKGLVDNRNCQMTCVRLLETLPVVYERLTFSASEWLGDLCVVPDVSNLKWFYDLVDWGKSSLLVISRHWKQCMLALLNLLKGSKSDIKPSTIDAIEAIVSCDTVVVDQLKERISDLTISLPNKPFGSNEGKVLKEKSIRPEPSFGKRISTLDTYFYGNRVEDAGIAKMAPNIKVEDVIVLSDSELEDGTLPNLETKESFPSELMEVEKTKLSTNRFEPFPSKIFVKDPQLSSQKQHNDLLGHNRVSSGVESPCAVSLFPSKSMGADKGQNKLPDASGVAASLRKANSSHKVPSGQLIRRQSSAQSEKEVIIKELICDDAEDPLDRALDNFKRPQSVLIKPSVSVPKRQAVQLQLPTNNKFGSSNKMGTGVRRLKPPRLDDWYRSILEMDYFSVIGSSPDNNDGNTTSTNFKEVPLCFQSQNHYVEIFRPLVLAEFKAQLHNSYIETSPEEMSCGSLSVLSVERVDDFHLVRGRPDEEASVASRGCLENDLVLLTKESLQNSTQHVHVLGKVERREKSDKSRTAILVIRFYLPNGSPRLDKVNRLLIERSKWFINRIMSITPQLREFHALSSLHDIPMLPVILNPVDRPLGCSDSKKVELSKLYQPMQQTLMSSFNDSQLQAISVAIGTQNSRRSFELSLIQGPPGTGKTRTIVAIVSVLLAVPSANKHCSSKTLGSSSKPASIPFTAPRTQISQSAAIARAWQDAAFAKQMVRDAEKDSFGAMEHSARRRVLICAQSNAAVDELVSRLNDGLYGIDGKVYRPYIVRVGNAKTVHPSSLPFFIDTLVEQRLAEDLKNQVDAKDDADMESSSSLRAKLEKVIDSIRYYESKRARLKDGNADTKTSIDGEPSRREDAHEITDADIGVKLNILYGQKKTICRDLAAAQAREKRVSEENRSLKHKIRKSILREAEIVVTTLSGCGGDLYGVCSESASSSRFGNFSEQTLFDVVVIDEAAQALEPATLIPLQLLKSNGTKCIMVGDPKQLPATVLSNLASKYLYECSMFERLQRAGHPIIMLTEQYRMHPEISRFPSLHFYENKLLDGAQMVNKAAPFHENECLGPYMFFDIVDGLEHHGKNSGSLSLYNESEVTAAIEVLKVFRKRYPSEFASRRKGIITPYRSQLSLLRSRFSSAFGAEIISDIEFNTVDGFQGREVDVLILSTVRASDSAAKPPMTNSRGIGFVADVRRMNVALTRAKYSLWIVGNARTLQTNFHWAALVQNAKERNLFISVTRPYSSVVGMGLSSPRDNLTSPCLDSRSSHPKQSERVKDASSGCKRINAQEYHRGKTKKIGGKPEKLKSRHSGGHDLTSHMVSQDLANSGLPAAGVSSQDKQRAMEMKLMTVKGQDQGEKSLKPKGKLVSSEDTVKKDPMYGRVEKKTTQVNVPLKKGSSMNNSIKKAKGVQGLSEHSKPNKFTSKISSTCSPSGGGNNEKSKEDKSKSSTREESKDIIASRKRQREAVDALLSSALISSKKPETSSKPSSMKRPPPNEPARGIFKPPRS